MKQFYDIEKDLIEQNEFWLDCKIEDDKKYTWHDNKVEKCTYSEHKQAIMEFLNSDKMVKAFEYDTVAKAGKNAYRFEQVISRYHLMARVRRSGNKVTLIKSKLRG